MKKLLAAIALSATMLAAPAQASMYPQEIAIGPVLGLAGPGVAWRQYVSPWLGFQVGANTWGVVSYTGGAVLVSPFHNQEGQRLYLSAGVATLWPPPVRTSGLDVVPAIGIGGSRLIHDRWTFFLDLSFFQLNVYRSISIPFVSPQLGFLYTF